MRSKIGFRILVISMIVLAMGFPATPQSKRRQNQIKDLIQESDLVALAVAQAYYPIIDLEKYQLETEKSGPLDPRRRSKFTYGTAYKLSLKEVLYQKASKDPDKPRRTYLVEDNIMIYEPGLLAHPLQWGQSTFYPGTEYLVFLKRANLDAGDFRRGTQQDLNTSMKQWESFPHPSETYFKVVDDPFAAKPIDEVWEKFADQTRAVAKEMAAATKDK